MALIKNVSDDVLKRVEMTVYNGIIAAKPAKQLAAELTADFGFAQRRAKLIARDQASKFNSDLNRIRHEQAGISDYIWSTSLDERVRPLHKKLEGKRFTYGKPTPAEGGGQPGQPINCRCVARAVVEF